MGTREGTARRRGRPRTTGPGEILDAARQRYARFGPRKTTMDEIARAAGCSRATVYAHFPSKHDLYVRLLEADTRVFVASLRALAEADAPPAHKLEQVVTATLEAYEGSPVLRGAVSGDGEMSLQRVAEPVVRSHTRQVIGLLRRLIEQGIESGEFRPVDSEASARLMYDLGRVVVLGEHGGRGGLSLRRLLTALDDLLARGLLAIPKHGKRARSRAGRS